MTRSLANYVIATGALACALILTADGTAQQKSGQQKAAEVGNAGYAKRPPSQPLPDGGSAPRTADGHPDLSGHWYVGVLGKEDATLVGSFGAQDPNVLPFDPKTTHEEKPSFQPWVIEKMNQEGNFKVLDDTRDPSSLDKLPKADQIAAIDVELIHLARNCMPGVHGMGAHGTQFVQGHDFLVQVSRRPITTTVLFRSMDGRIPPIPIRRSTAKAAAIGRETRWSSTVWPLMRGFGTAINGGSTATRNT